MSLKLYINIAIRVALLGFVGMMGTFIPEFPEMKEFFGDYVEIINGNPYDKWGARHYWYFWTMMVLFILSLISLIISIVKLITKEYPNL